MNASHEDSLDVCRSAWAGDHHRCSITQASERFRHGSHNSVFGHQHQVQYRTQAHQPGSMGAGREDERSGFCNRQIRCSHSNFSIPNGFAAGVESKDFRRLVIQNMWTGKDDFGVLSSPNSSAKLSESNPKLSPQFVGRMSRQRGLRERRTRLATCFW